MKLVCAWCLKEMGTVEGSCRPDSEFSHGICRSCRNNIEFQEGVSIQRYIDSFAIPIMVVDDNVVVKAVNKRACEMLSKEPGEIVQHLGGDVFECEYARHPGGCGKTVHCSGCTIRKVVTKTFTTGEPQFKIPATITPFDPDRIPVTALVVSAVKCENMVMLRLERRG